MLSYDHSDGKTKFDILQVLTTRIVLPAVTQVQ